jgi:hypothetical protein
MVVVVGTRVVVAMGAVVVGTVVAAGVLLDVVEGTVDALTVMVMAMEVGVPVVVVVERTEPATVDGAEDWAGRVEVATDVTVDVIEELVTGTVVGLTVVDGLPLPILLWAVTTGFAATVGIFTNTVLHTVLAFTFVHFFTCEKPLGTEAA